jgi:hypothetical protein
MLLRMRFNLLKHNNLMLRSERRERLEAWAACTVACGHPSRRIAHAMLLRMRFRDILPNVGNTVPEPS